MANEEEAVEVSTFTSLEYLEASGWDMVELASRSGLHINTVRHAIMGGPHKLKEDSAWRIAEAFGLSLKEITWPVELTNQGRMPLTGGKYTMGREIHEPCCPTHFILLPSNGKCDECAA